MNGQKQIAVMQPYFFPYIGYWQLIGAADVFVIYDDGKYIPHGWMHRNRILGYDNRTPMPIGLHIDHASSNRKIYEIERVDDPFNEKDLLRTLGMRYGKAPFYNDAMDIIAPVICNPETRLVGYLSKLIRDVSGYLGIETEFHLSTEVDKTGLDGARQKAAAICDHFDIHRFINPIGGTAFYDKGEWRAGGVDISFLQRDEDIRYRQFGREFVKDLSIIDLMMFCSKDELSAILRKYRLL